MTVLNRILKRILAGYTILIALAVCWQCVDMYRDAYNPEMLSDSGMPTERVYTPEKVSVRIEGILVLSAAYPLVLAGVLFTGRSDARKGRAAALPPEYTLARIKKRIDKMPEAAISEERHRRRIWTAAGALVFICAAACLIYLLDGGNFSSWDLEPVMAGMMRHVSPWVIVALAVMWAASAYSGRSVVREIGILKPCAGPERAQARKAPSGIPVKAARFILLTAAVVFIVLGVMNGDPRSVLTKAIRICTECIGLG